MSPLIQRIALALLLTCLSCSGRVDPEASVGLSSLAVEELRETSRKRAFTYSKTGPERLHLRGTVSIAVPPKHSPVAEQAAIRLAAELNRYEHVSVITRDLSQTSHPDDIDIRLLCLDSASSPPVQGLPHPGPDGFLLKIVPARKRMIIGGRGQGILRGVYELTRLLKCQDSGCYWSEAVICDTPELSIRMARPILINNRLPEDMGLEASMIASLDWWARWGLNYAIVPEPRGVDIEEDIQFLEWIVTQGHKRGIRMGVNLGGRRLCASDTQAVDNYLKKASRLLESGCDFCVVLFDDLPASRTGGHCDACRQRFGASLAREHKFIIESLQQLMRERNPIGELFWCPTYYSLGMTGYANAAETPDRYFEILGASEAVRQAYMFHCAFDPDFAEYLDAKALRKRVWWYNGIRTHYYMVSRPFDGYHAWGEPLRIADFDGFPSLFSPFYHGWLMPTFQPAHLSNCRTTSQLRIANRDEQNRTVISESAIEHLATLPSRMEGMYLCSNTTSYHTAMAGQFATHPAQFDETSARKAVIEAIFGSGSFPLVENWQGAYAEAMMILAGTTEQGLPQAAQQQVSALTQVLRTNHAELESSIMNTNSALPPPLVHQFIKEMDRAHRLIHKAATNIGTQSRNRLRGPESRPDLER